MPKSAFREDVRVVIDVDGEDVVFICRKPTGQEVSKFLSARFEQGRRGKVESHLYEARERFMRSIVVDIENATYQNADRQILPLTAVAVLSDADKQFASGVLKTDVRDWRDLIPANWYSSAAMHFEDAANNGADEGN